MLKTIILGLVASSFTLASMTASATSDDQYPASNFEPKVVFIDKELAGHLSAASTDQEAEKKSVGKSASKPEFDPKYPAAYFQPKVIYP